MTVRNNLMIKKQELQIEKMKLDKFFSIFLDEHELHHENLEDPNWKIYKEKLAEYNDIEHEILLINYELNK